MKKYFIYIIPFLCCLILFFVIKQKPPVQKPLSLRSANFSRLPGWDASHLGKSLGTFQVSCKTFLKQNPEHLVGSPFIAMRVKDWQPACRAAMEISPVSDTAAKSFFEQWFSPVEFVQRDSVEGLFTGYYSPLLKGSLTPSKKYSVPLYGLPSDLVSVNLGLFFKDLSTRRLVGRIKDGMLVPYYTRKAINKGAIKKTANVIVWVDDSVDRQFLEIQGSGVVELENGERMYVGYAGENGASYLPLARILIKKGVMTKDNASMQGIKQYLENHPEEKQKILNQNKSFVFFRKLSQKAAFGAQGVPLTPGYSMAIDRKWVPLGTPIWLNTTSPGPHSDSENTLQRLFIAQDTGGAIKGAVRGDVYWGAGKKATFAAGHMKNKGTYWLLLPRQIASNLG